MTESDFQTLHARLVDITHVPESVRDDILAMVAHADALRTRVVDAVDDGDDWDKDEPALGFVAYPPDDAPDEYEALSHRRRRARRRG